MAGEYEHAGKGIPDKFDKRYLRLPTTLGKIGLPYISDAALMEVATAACAPGEIIQAFLPTP